MLKRLQTTVRLNCRTSCNRKNRFTKANRNILTSYYQIEKKNLIAPNEFRFLSTYQNSQCSLSSSSPENLSTRILVFRDGVRKNAQKMTN